MSQCPPTVCIDCGWAQGSLSHHMRRAHAGERKWCEACDATVSVRTFALHCTMAWHVHAPERNGGGPRVATGDGEAHSPPRRTHGGDDELDAAADEVKVAEAADDGHPCGSVPVAPLLHLEPGASFRDAPLLAVFGDTMYKPTVRTLRLWVELATQAAAHRASRVLAQRSPCTNFKRQGHSARSGSGVLFREKLVPFGASLSSVVWYVARVPVGVVVSHESRPSPRALTSSDLHNDNTRSDILHYATTPGTAAQKEAQRRRDTRDLVSEAAGVPAHASTFDSDLGQALRLMWSTVRHGTGH